MNRFWLLVSGLSIVSVSHSIENQNNRQSIDRGYPGFFRPYRYTPEQMKELSDTLNRINQNSYTESFGERYFECVPHSWRPELIVIIRPY